MCPAGAGSGSDGVWQREGGVLNCLRCYEHHDVARYRRRPKIDAPKRHTNAGPVSFTRTTTLAMVAASMMNYDGLLPEGPAIPLGLA